MARNSGRPHLCLWCGRLFYSYAHNALYDRNACRQAAYRYRKAIHRTAVLRTSAMVAYADNHPELQQSVLPGLEG